MAGVVSMNCMLRKMARSGGSLAPHCAGVDKFRNTACAILFRIHHAQSGCPRRNPKRMAKATFGFAWGDPIAISDIHVS